MTTGKQTGVDREQGIGQKERTKSGQKVYKNVISKISSTNPS